MDYVAKENGFEDADAVRKVLEITNESNTELIDIKATTKDPKLSQAVAEGTAEYFIDTMSKSLNVRNIEVVTHAKVAETIWAFTGKEHYYQPRNWICN